MDGTVASTEVTVLSAVLWSLGLARWISTLLGAKFVPMVSGSTNVELEGLLKVSIFVQVALSLVVCDFLSTVWMSSLEETPSEEMLLGSLNWSLIL